MVHLIINYTPPTKTHTERFSGHRELVWRLLRDYARIKRLFVRIEYDNLIDNTM